MLFSILAYLINVIMSYVTFFNVELLLNGGAQDELNPSWGLDRKFHYPLTILSCVWRSWELLEVAWPSYICSLLIT